MVYTVKFSLYLYGLNEILQICAHSSTVVALLVYIFAKDEFTVSGVYHTYPYGLSGADVARE